MLKQCPMRADFAQEAWVLRCVGWEECGPHLPAWLDQARSVVGAVKEQIRKEEAAHAAAVNRGKR